MAFLLGKLGTSHPTILITILAIAFRLITWILLHSLHRLVPAFDSSGSGSSTLRWDAIHFTAIATRGYEHEQQIAFQPGWPLTIRLTAWLFAGGREFSVGEVTRVGEIIAAASHVGAAVMLYRLTNIVSTPSFSLITTLLYLLPPCPAVLSSAYSEPLFALLTFTGFHFTLTRQFLSAAIVLAGATSIRATGVLAIGPVGWTALFGDQSIMSVMRRPTILLRRALSTLVPVMIIVSPFILSQVYFYHALCDSPTREAWCDKTIPLVYSHVQEKYWNVGMLNYWSLDQLPNILLAVPVLLVSFGGAYRYFALYFKALSRSERQTNTSTSKPPTAGVDPVKSSLDPFIPLPYPHSDKTINLLLPFYIHSTALTLLLLFSAHTQIALRVCTTDPVIWWSLSAMAFRWRGTGVGVSSGGDSRVNGAIRDSGGRSRGRDNCQEGMTGIGKIWVWWSVIFGAVSLVLWSGHYPPA